MIDDAGVETTPPTSNTGNQGADVTSDPAKDDTEGQDWSDEGGATPAGPATDTDG